MDAEMDVRKKKIDARKRHEKLQKVETSRRQLSSTHRKSSQDRNMEYSDEEKDGEIHRKQLLRNHVDSDQSKCSKAVRKIRKGEIIKPREAAMDREAIKSKQMIRDKSSTLQRKIIRSEGNYNQNDSDSNDIEDELPDLRQRLVDRKQKRHSDKQEPNYNSISPNDLQQKTSILPKMRQKDIESFGSEEEHQVSSEFGYDRNGRNILPKNLRIQATIRNDRHEDLNVSREERENNSNYNTKTISKNRKRHTHTDENDESSFLGSKKQRTENACVGDEDEDELLEMRRNAIESMQRRKQASNFETRPNVVTTLRKDNHPIKQLKRRVKSVKHVRHPDNKKESVKERQAETVKREILEIQEGDSDAISSISSVEEGTDMSDVSENTTEEVGYKPNKKSKDLHEESEISLSSSEAEDEINTSIPIHTTNKSQIFSSNAVIHDKKPESGKKDPQFIVTLDGINSAYFKKEDKEVSKGGLKLKKHKPTSETVYITSNRAPIMNRSNTSISQAEKPVISLPYNKENDMSTDGIKNRVDGNSIVEKPKAMVAPLRKEVSPATNAVKKISSNELSLNSTVGQSNTSMPLAKQEKQLISKEINASGSKDIPKRKRILPPELSPTESPHSVLAGTNRYISRTINQSSSYSPGIM